MREFPTKVDTPGNNSWLGCLAAPLRQKAPRQLLKIRKVKSSFLSLSLSLLFFYSALFAWLLSVLTYLRERVES